MCKLFGLQLYSFKIHKNSVEFITTKWDIVYNFLIFTTIFSLSIFSKISTFQETPFHISFIVITITSLIAVISNFYYSKDIKWLLKCIFDLKKHLKGNDQHNSDFCMLLCQKGLNIFLNIILSISSNFDLQVDLSWNTIISTYLESTILLLFTLFYLYIITELGMLLKLYKNDNIENNINFVKTIKKYFEKTNHIHQFPILLCITIFFIDIMTPFAIFIITQENDNLDEWSWPIVNKYFFIIFWILQDFYEIFILLYYIEKFNKNVSKHLMKVYFWILIHLI